MAKNIFGLSLQKGISEYTAFSIGKGQKTDLCADGGQNVDCSDGRLRTGIGVTPLYLRRSDGEYPVNLDSNIERINSFFFIPSENNPSDTNIGCLGETGMTYLFKSGYNDFISRREFYSPMRFYYLPLSDGTKQIWVAGEDGVFTYSEKDGAGEQVCKDGSVIGCVYQNRMFFVREPYTLWYSAPYEPLDYTIELNGGGEISFPSDKGKIVDVQPFDGKLYLFYEYAIAELEVHAADEDFVYKTLPYDGGRILGGSVAAVSDKLFFLSEEGVFSFDGNRIKRVCQNIDISPKQSIFACHHAGVHGKYAAVYFDEKGVERCVVVDAETGKGYFSFVPEASTAYEGRVYCRVADYVGVLDKDGRLPPESEYVFSVSDTDLGVDGVKTLTGVFMRGEGRCALEISNGKRTTQVEVNLSKNSGKAKMRLRGERFSLRILPYYGCTLSGLTFSWVKLGEK